MLLLVIKAEQIQAGASWDSVTSISVVVLLLGGLVIILSLVGSRIVHTLRIKRTRRARHRHRHR